MLSNMTYVYVLAIFKISWPHSSALKTYQVTVSAVKSHIMWACDLLQRCLDNLGDFVEENEFMAYSLRIDHVE